uniref:Uncharacterized protein n=1 Tax=Monopterus albus TaxID=43700 RepID=A0A3Q3IYH3_MONAL
MTSWVCIYVLPLSSCILSICCSFHLNRDLLDRPVETLLMNQADRFRETQEQRIFLNQGYHVGGEFWSLPQRYGDEMSGITATLTQTEQGSREPVTYVGRPSSILRESGTHRLYSVSQFFPSASLSTLFLLTDISGLEVIGSGKPFTCVTVKTYESFLEHTQSLTGGICPHLCLYVHLSHYFLHCIWPSGPLLLLFVSTSHSPKLTHQGEVGISSTIIFEAPTGEVASSHLELHNEGSAAIFYSWQQLPLPQHCPNLQSQTKSPHFYFSSPSGVILPGDTLRVEFMFKSEEPGIKTELWQLNTHPVLLQGASLQVTLKGVALYEDNTADQRRFIEMKLEKTAIVKTCLSVVYEVLRGVHTPERPSSPAELYITEEQVFVRKNPKVKVYRWEQFSLSISKSVLFFVQTLFRTFSSANRERSYEIYNGLVKHIMVCLAVMVVCAAPCRQQLWVILLDTMAGEAMRLRNLLGVPEKKAWTENKDKSQLPDAGETTTLSIIHRLVKIMLLFPTILLCNRFG